MARTNQGGSILGFLIIGGILTVLLLGGVYYVQQRTAPSQVVTDDQPTGQGAGDQTETKPAAEAPKQEAPKEDAPKAEPQPTQPSANQLPQTGPAEMISSLLGLGILSGMSIAYVRSRRHNVTL